MGADLLAAQVGIVADRRTRDAGFTDFYVAWFGRVARYTYRLVHDEELARDLAQEAFVRVLTRWSRIADPEAYVFRVASNLVRTWARRHHREIEAWKPVTGPNGPELLVRLVVHRLPRRYREVVALYYFADLSVAAVAAAVGRPAGTVKRQLAEARALLAQDMEGWHD